MFNFLKRYRIDVYYGCIRTYYSSTKTCQIGLYWESYYFWSELKAYAFGHATKGILVKFYDKKTQIYMVLYDSGFIGETLTEIDASILPDLSGDTK